MSALISVLLPAHRAEATLDAALASVRRQREPRFECIVVDDGSDDHTRAIAERHAREDPRLRVIATEHRGLVSALETGLAECRGRWIARMDADDLMHRRRLELQVALLTEHPQLAGCGTRVRSFPSALTTEGRRRYLTWLDRIATPEDVERERFIECPLVHPTLMLSRELVRYRDMGWPEDYDLVLRLLAGGARLGVVPQRLLSWRERPDRLSRSSSVYALERFTDCKAAFIAESFLRDRRDYVLWGYGATGRMLSRALLRHDKQPACVVEIHPRRIGNLIRGAPVVRPEMLAELPRRPIVVSVSGEEARTEIRGILDSMRFAEGTDFVCAA